MQGHFTMLDWLVLALYFGLTMSIGFYFYRRTLEDLTDWVIRILYENTDEAQNQLDLKGIQEDCMAGWPYLEVGIKAVERQLRET